MDQSIILLVVMFAALYFFMIRPENKRKKQAQAMRDGLKKGDVITSIGGIVGKIVMVNPNTIIIETSEDRVRMELTGERATEAVVDQVFAQFCVGK